MSEIARDHVRNDRRALILSYLMLYGPLSGQDLLTEIEADWGHRLSPGTLYPCLNDLIDEGVIGRMDKCGNGYETFIADGARAKAEIQETMHSHLAFCGFYAEGMDAEAPEPPDEAERVEILQDDVSWEPVSKG